MGVAAGVVEDEGFGFFAAAEGFEVGRGWDLDKDRGGYCDGEGGEEDQADELAHEFHLRLPFEFEHFGCQTKL